MIHSRGKLILVDNYDSFTYNIYQYFRELNADVTVIKNDELSVDDTTFSSAAGIVLSPGPGSPSEAGISAELIDTYQGKIPFLGVCLGLQVIAEKFGGLVRRSSNVMHGKTSELSHDETGVFAGLEQGFCVARYHSLIVDPKSMPDCLEVNAWVSGTNEIMGLRHKDFLIQGVQFHPEAILSQNGHRIFDNFLRQVESV